MALCPACSGPKGSACGGDAESHYVQNIGLDPYLDPLLAGASERAFYSTDKELSVLSVANCTLAPRALAA